VNDIHTVTVENLSHAADKLPEQVHIRIPVSRMTPDRFGSAHKIISVPKDIIPWGHYKTPFLVAEITGDLWWDFDRNVYRAEIEILKEAT
jgi:hypothetical protein